ASDSPFERCASLSSVGARAGENPVAALTGTRRKPRTIPPHGSQQQRSDSSRPLSRHMRLREVRHRIHVSSRSVRCQLPIVQAISPRPLAIYLIPGRLLLERPGQAEILPALSPAPGISDAVCSYSSVELASYGLAAE